MVLGLFEEDNDEAGLGWILETDRNKKYFVLPSGRTFQCVYTLQNNDKAINTT